MTFRSAALYAASRLDASRRRSASGAHPVWSVRTAPLLWRLHCHPFALIRIVLAPLKVAWLIERVANKGWCGRVELLVRFFLRCSEATSVLAQSTMTVWH